MRDKLFWGIILLAVWVMTRFSHSTTRLVVSHLQRAVVPDESYYLFTAAATIAMSNAIKAAFLYCGWFLVGEGVAERTRKEQFAWCIPLIMIPLSYQAMVYFPLPIVPPFGFSAFFSLLSVLFLQFICRDVSHSGYKIVIQIMIVFAIQWFDVIPALTDYGFGRGELSMAVKNMATLMDKEDFLDTQSRIFFCVSATMALTMAKLFVSYEKQLRQLNLIRARERDFALLWHEQAQARLYLEMQYLVHDLKSPLTVVIGLANLLAESKDLAKTASHCEVILKASEQMEQMINEIKAPEAVRLVSVNELFNFTLSQIRPQPWGDDVIVEMAEDFAATKLQVNQIRFSRALVNLLDNARNATRDLQCPLIKLYATTDGSDVLIGVEDNGPGFLTPCNDGLSSWGSTGLGLAFVKKVVEDGKGNILFENMTEGGLRCVVRMPVASEVAG